MRFIRIADVWLQKIEIAALVSLVGAMIALSFVQVVLRLFFSTGILWADPLLRHMVVWAGFFGAALAAAHTKHFAMDSAAHLLPQKLHRGAEIAAKVFTAVVCGVLVKASVRFLHDEMTADVILFSLGRIEVRAVWLEFILPVGFALVLFHTLASLMRGEPR